MKNPFCARFWQMIQLWRCKVDSINRGLTQKPDCNFWALLMVDTDRTMVFILKGTPSWSFAASTTSSLLCVKNVVCHVDVNLSKIGPPKYISEKYCRRKYADWSPVFDCLSSESVINIWIVSYWVINLLGTAASRTASLLLWTEDSMNSADRSYSWC